MKAIFLFLILHWFLSLFFQTFFLHRYAAHRMFTMSRFWERVFYVLTFLTQGSSFLNPKAYAMLHRNHHAHSDTGLDPHSPHRFPNPVQMMWQTKIAYDSLKEKAWNSSSDHNAPEWKALDRISQLWSVRILFGILYTSFYLHFLSNWWQLFLLPLHFLMGPLHGTIVNWCGHKYGYRNFEIQDQSRNTLWVDLILLGELYQNNHHHFPNRMNFAVRWFEVDPVYPFIKFFGLLRIIRLDPVRRFSSRSLDASLVA